MTFPSLNEKFFKSNIGLSEIIKIVSPSNKPIKPPTLFKSNRARSNPIEYCQIGVGCLIICNSAITDKAVMNYTKGFKKYFIPFLILFLLLEPTFKCQVTIVNLIQI